MRQEIEFLLPIISKITLDQDAREFVRIYLNSLDMEDKESFYTELSEHDTRFDGVFVARITVPTDKIKISGGIFYPGNVNLIRQARANGWKGLIYIKAGKEQYTQSAFINPMSQDPIVDYCFINSTAFAQNGSVTIPNGRNAASEIIEKGYYIVLEIYTDKYTEPSKCTQVQKLNSKKKSNEVAVVNTEVFSLE
jgi:hypothetical protein